MLHFRNDYQSSTIPEVLEGFSQHINDIYAPYGMDELTQHAKEVLSSKMRDHNLDIHFVNGGTLANLIIFRAILRSYEGVIACKTAHINTHETGAIEACGHKVVEIDDTDGKVTPEKIQRVYDCHHRQYEHMVDLKAVYISNATELGTIYSEDELHALHEKCKELNMYLVLDGERIGAALMSGVGYTLNDVAACCDIFTIGVTKNGGLFGTAIVITNDILKDRFRFAIKQSGGLMAKSWLIALQFSALFENDKFYEIAKKENEFAIQIQNCCHNLGYPFLVKSYTNQIFPALTEEQYNYLKNEVDFEIWDIRNGYYFIRIVTSFSTTQEDVNALCECFRQASKIHKKESV